MICHNCNKEIDDESEVCEFCGQKIIKLKVYDYISVKSTSRTMEIITDTYRNLGYIKTSDSFGYINFKRDRMIKNKSELLRLQKNINESINKISKYEDSKKDIPTCIALVIGVFGALVMGTGFSLIMVYEELILGIIIGLLGIVLCLPSYPVYKNMYEKRVNIYGELIGQEYDKIYLYCNEGQKLLN